ncbi:uncharacterized protein AC631_01643 [Debaryomyces fabryi]|uniref:RING-type domain-containing protein n=1 Tax=Debaryomyces fabryi TaxID=58627 RepID=A0A0V1Q248_9ASCO|nr:uncharacterized protein AC631_01643 [Debaryomyces fabryi]KSA02560.1 hypothetical protein AC631_01643 [Debaryomyces fabryi]CUM55953.1 unnamed protein product [Debaryomyces fabryi]
MSNNTILKNTTSASIDSNEDQDDEWFLAKLIIAFIDAIWEQSETSSQNRILWDRFGGVATYCCSIYGVSCLVMALILNRTLVMASTNSSRNQQSAISRQRGILNTPKLAELLKNMSMVSFKLFAVGLLLYNCYYLLVALNLYYHTGLTVNDSLPWYHVLVPDNLFEYDPDVFNSNRYMATPKDQVNIGPTTDMYWPVFLGFCFLLFIETFVSVVQGKQPYTESGITIFEHSLAFQEVSSTGFFGSSRLYKRPTEQVLMACIFLTMNHINIHIGGLLYNNRYRLIPLTIIGLAFLTYFVSCFTNGNIWKFPTIIIMSFVPQVLIMLIIFVSVFIFSMAVLAKGFQLQDLNYASFLLYENHESDTEFRTRNLNIGLQDDFYTALLNLGMLAITLAGKSSYITELSLVTVDEDTWLERSIWQKLKYQVKSVANLQTKTNTNSVMDYLKKNNISGYGNMIMTPSKRLISGERTDVFHDDSTDLKNSKSISVLRKRILFLKEIFSDLMQLLYGLIIDSFLLNYVPKIFSHYVLRRPISENRNILETDEDFEIRKRKAPAFLRPYIRRNVRNPKKVTSLRKEVTPSEQSVDLNDYTEEQLAQDYISLLLEKELPDVDDSEDYYQTNYYELDLDEESDIESIYLSSTTSLRNQLMDDASHTLIDELLSPEEFQNLMSSANVDILQRHLNHDSRANGILTRSRFNALNSGLTTQENNLSSQDEISKLLELILNKRKAQIYDLSSDGSNNNTEDYDLNSKLDCVICQTNVREIITWPCKCFAICESCRLSLISKGIEGCVCCRRDVEGVSKVFIP